MMALVPVLLLTFAVPSAPAMADGSLVRLGREPSARPVGDVIGDLLSRFDEPVESDPAAAGNSEIGGGTGWAGGYPITSTLQSTRDGTVHHTSIPLSHPLCVVDAGPSSRSWLTRHRERLLRMGAACVLAAADGPDQTAVMRRIAHPVPLHPLPFDAIAEIHGLRTVPAILVGEGHR